MSKIDYIFLEMSQDFDRMQYINELLSPGLWAPTSWLPSAYAPLSPPPFILLILATLIWYIWTRLIPLLLSKLLKLFRKKETYES